MRLSLTQFSSFRLAAARMCTFLLALSMLVMPVEAASEKRFFSGIKGKWSGAGQIVAGKYKGTRFTCVFDGDLPQKLMGMSIDGNCRVGVFNQKMSALVTKRRGKYKGSFLDGAKGKGLDIVSGRYVRSQNLLVMDIVRKKLRGAMRAQLKGNNKMNISISVIVGKQYIPVIGLDLKRRG